MVGLLCLVRKMIKSPRWRKLRCQQEDLLVQQRSPLIHLQSVINLEPNLLKKRKKRSKRQLQICLQRNQRLFKIRCNQFQKFVRTHSLKKIRSRIIHFWIKHQRRNNCLAVEIKLQLLHNRSPTMLSQEWLPNHRLSYLHQLVVTNHPYLDKNLQLAHHQDFSVTILHQLLLANLVVKVLELLNHWTTHLLQHQLWSDNLKEVSLEVKLHQLLVYLDLVHHHPQLLEADQAYLEDKVHHQQFRRVDLGYLEQSHQLREVVWEEDYLGQSQLANRCLAAEIQATLLHQPQLLGWCSEELAFNKHREVACLAHSNKCKVNNCHKEVVALWCRGNQEGCKRVIYSVADQQ